MAGQWTASGKHLEDAVPCRRSEAQGRYMSLNRATVTDLCSFPSEGIIPHDGGSYDNEGVWS